MKKIRNWGAHSLEKAQEGLLAAALADTAAYHRTHEFDLELGCCSQMSGEPKGLRRSASAKKNDDCARDAVKILSQPLIRICLPEGRRHACGNAAVRVYILFLLPIQ